MSCLRLAVKTTRIIVVCTLVSLSVPLVFGNEFRVIGLETAWSTSVQSSQGSKSVISAQLWADPSNAVSFAVVELGDRSIQVSTESLDDSYKPLGEEGATAQAKRQAARYLGRSDDIDVNIRQIPRLRLVVVSGDGYVQCWDAETGNLHWANPCGPTTSPVYPAALSQAGVVVIQGEKLYHLDWETGRHVAVKKLPTGSANSVAVIDAPVAARDGSRERIEINTLALVSDYRGFINGYSLNNAIAPWTYQLVGRSVGSPVSLPDRSSTAIATDRGWLYVFSGDLNPKVQFRYESGNRFGGSLTSGPEAFYVGNMSGTLSKISVRDRGVLDWSYRLSQAITAPPLFDYARKRIYVATEAGELSAIDDQSGLLAWNQIVFGSSRVRGPIALCNGSVVCRTYSHTLVTYDASSGQILGQTSPLPLDDKMIVNSVTDRVYIIRRGGNLTCLRPIGKQLPAFYPSIQADPAEGESDLQPSETIPSPVREPSRSPDPFSTETPQETYGDDPFGGDPF